MTMPAIIQSDRFEVALVHSDSGLGGKSRQLVDLNGSYRAKSYDMKGMGTNAQINDLGLMTMIANTQSLVLSGEPVEVENLVDNDMAQQRLDIELLRAFGVEIATMGDFIQEVMAGLSENSPLSAEQKAQLQDLVTEIITLKKLTSLGALPQGAERLEKLIAETADKIADILKDGLDNRALSKAVAEFAYNMLDKTAQKYGLTELSEKLTAIEGRMNPQNYLAKSVAELVTQLTALLEQPDIEDTVKEDITKMLDDLAEQPEGKPLSREILKQLDGLAEKLPEKHAVKIQKTIERVRDANIVLKAEISGLTVAQVRQVENVISDLETMKDGIENSKEPLTADQQKLVEQLDKTIKALDANPADIKAVQEVAKLQSRLSVPEIAMMVPAALTGVVVGVLAKLSPVQTMQETTLAKRHNIDIAKIRDIAKQQDAVKIINALPVIEVKTVAARIADTVKTMAAFLPFIPKTATGATPSQPDKTITLRGRDVTIPADDGKAPEQPAAKETPPSPPPPSPTEGEGDKNPPPSPEQKTDADIDGNNTPDRQDASDPQEGREDDETPPPQNPDPADDTTPPETDTQPTTPEDDARKQDEITPDDKPPCGDNCQCKTDFNEAASGDLTPEKVAELNAQLQEEFGDKYKINNDGTVTTTDDNGKPEIVTVEEMNVRIEVDRIVEQAGQDNWNKFVALAGGDRDKALEIYHKNAAAENIEAKRGDAEITTTKTDSKDLDAAIKAAIEARQDKPDSNSQKTDDRLKSKFDDCNCGLPDHHHPKPGEQPASPAPEKKEMKKRAAPANDAPPSEGRQFKGRTVRRNPS